MIFDGEDIYYPYLVFSGLERKHQSLALCKSAECSVQFPVILYVTTLTGNDLSVLPFTTLSQSQIDIAKEISNQYRHQTCESVNAFFVVSNQRY